MDKQRISLIIAMLVWGIAWPFGKYVANQADIVFLIAIRFLFSALSLLLFIIWLKFNLKISKKGLILTLLAAVSMSLYNIAFFLGLRYGLASAGGVLVTTLNPILTYFIISWYSKKAISKKDYLGLVIGLIGGAIIIEIWQKGLQQMLASGNIFFLSCAFFWMLLTLISKASEKEIANPVFSFYTFSWITIFWFLYIELIHPNSFPELKKFKWDFRLAMVYLSVFSVAVATSIYFLATRKLGPQAASSYIFIVPVGALLGSWLLLGEIPQLSTLIGGFLTLIAVYIINKVKIIEKTAKRN